MATQVFSAVLNLASAVVLARWLGPTGKGAFSVVLTSGLAAAVVFGFGLYPGLSSWSARRLVSPRIGLLITIGSTAVAVLLATLVIQLLPSAWSLAGQLSLVPAVCAVTVFGQLQMAVAQGRGRMGALAANALLSLCLQLGLYSAFAAREGGPEAVGVALLCYIVAQGAGDLVGWVLIAWKAEAHWRVAHDLSGLLVFGLSAAPVQVLNALNFRLDILVLAGIAGVRETGLYSMAATGAQILMMVPTAVGLALSTDFGRSTREVSAELAGRGMRLAAQGALAAAIAGCVLAPLVVPRLLGPGYVRSIPMFWIMAPGMTIFALSGVTVSYYWHARLVAWAPNLVVAISVISDIVLLLWLGRRYGGIGAAWASTAAYAIAGSVNVIIFSRITGLTMRELAAPRWSDYSSIRGLLGARR